VDWGGRWISGGLGRTTLDVAGRTKLSKIENRMRRTAGARFGAGATGQKQNDLEYRGKKGGGMATADCERRIGAMFEGDEGNSSYEAQ